MKDKAFAVFQRIGRSFMLPIALLPVAGLLLGLGSSFTNDSMIAAYHLSGILSKGNFLYTLLTVMKDAGNAVFSNLPFLFAVGCAIGMAKNEKAVAALAASIAFIIMHTSIATMLQLAGKVTVTDDGGFTSTLMSGQVAASLGIPSLQMGVFGGIIVGLGVASLHNRFYKQELPAALSFFAGTRFVPIISSIVFLFVGIVMYFVWPWIQVGISQIGLLVKSSGYIGTLIYGFIERALIPFGLHHVFYLPFWQTELGGTMTIAGKAVSGAQNIFFAQLADSSTTSFTVEATRFMSGKFPFMIFGLPGAALAMYRQALPAKKKVAGSLLISAAFTAMLTGITEPIEFTFLFVSPALYLVHCVFAGCSYMIMHMLNVGVGMTFSGGIIDLLLFGILQGAAKTRWYWIPIVGVGYFFLYYSVFTFAIKKFDLKTPGREDDDSEVKLYSRADVDKKTGRNTSIGSGSSSDSAAAAPGYDELSAAIMMGLGGKANISDVDCCATRLRTTVFDSNKVSDAALKATGASGVIHKGTGVQVIYGPRVTVIKSNLEEFLQSPAAAAVEAQAAAAPAPAAAQAPEKTEAKTSSCVEGGELVIKAPVSGKAIKLEGVNDGVFSEGMLGQGAAIEPSEGKVYAPFDGEVTMVFDTNHAIGLSAKGVEVLIHIGLDTVKLKGQHFTPHVKNGDHVKAGTLMMDFDIPAIKAAGYPVVTPVIITNTDDVGSVTQLKEGTVKHGESFVSVK